MNWNHKIRPLCILMRKTWGASCCWSRALVSKVLQVLLIIRSAANVTSSCSYSYYRKLWVNSRQIGHSSTHSRHHQPCSVCIIVIVVLRCGVELEFDFTLNFWQHQQLKQRLHLVVCGASTEFDRFVNQQFSYGRRRDDDDLACICASE